jgi:ion channel-forming bestrophin family protein
MRKIMAYIDYRKNWLFVLISNPSIYLKKLLINTATIGVVTFAMSWLYMHSDMRETKIPVTMHSLIGIAIGFMLVFRANTSYDRWFEGRKSITSMTNALGIFSLKLKACTGDLRKEEKNEIKNMLVDFFKNFISYMKCEDHSLYEGFKEKQNALVYAIMSKLKSLEMSDKNSITSGDVGFLERFLSDAVSSANICERIKDTPIPMSYALHTKVSIFIYLLSLPFGLFYDLKLWSTLMVMVIFYIIYGIELISAEIENPFHGDPNDIPVELFKEKTIGIIEKSLA